MSANTLQLGMYPVDRINYEEVKVQTRHGEDC